MKDVSACGVVELMLRRPRGARVLAGAAAAASAGAQTHENTLVLDLKDNGRVVIQLLPDVAPKHVERIKTLVGRGSTTARRSTG